MAHLLPFRIDVDIHVDAASGGFVAPFVYPYLEWDFRVPRVKSINVSGHKYGLVYPGIGWIIWRDAKELPDDLVFHLDYLGGDEPTFNLNFSRSSLGVLGQYYNFLRLGRVHVSFPMHSWMGSSGCVDWIDLPQNNTHTQVGYSDVITSCLEGARFLSFLLKDTGYFDVLSEVHRQYNEGLPLVCLRMKPPGDGKKLNFDEYDLMCTLRQNGWVVPAYKVRSA